MIKLAGSIALACLLTACAVKGDKAYNSSEVNSKKLTKSYLYEVKYSTYKLKKYGENQGKSRKTAELMTYGIIEKAKFSDGDITDQEVVIVKRHLDLLKRKNRNVTKILSKLK